MSWIVRRANSADLDALVIGCRALALETEHIHLDPEIVTLGVANVLDDDTRGFYLVAASDPAHPAAGQLMVTREWSDWRNGWFWWIQSVYVTPGSRRSGVYRALYAAVLEHARNDESVCGVRLYVERHNLDALATYRALGMDRTDYNLMEVDFSGIRARRHTEGPE